MSAARDPAITDHVQFGRVAAALGWVPAPRFLLRRAVVLEWMQELPKGRVLDIGTGAGSLLADLHGMGFSPMAVETSPDARVLATRMLRDLPDIQVLELPMQAWVGKFDVLLSFEVLEHIEDDTAALSDWVRFVRPGGRVIISVPAHASRWTATDTWAGHVRRYDRAHLVALAARCGIQVERCENYGFPLANIIEPVNAWAHARQAARTPKDDATSRDARSAASGVRRSMETRLFPLLAAWPGRAAMHMACAVQRWFRQTELGNGFILQGRKPS